MLDIKGMECAWPVYSVVTQMCDNCNPTLFISLNPAAHNHMHTAPHTNGDSQHTWLGGRNTGRYTHSAVYTLSWSFASAIFSNKLFSFAL